MSSQLSKRLTIEQYRMYTCMKNKGIHVYTYRSQTVIISGSLHAQFCAFYHAVPNSLSVRIVLLAFEVLFCCLSNAIFMYM